MAGNPNMPPGSPPARKITWHNVKPTPPGTVKMLTAMSEEIERYLEAKDKQ